MSRFLGLVALAVLIWLVLETALVRLRLSVKVTARPVQPPPEPIAATLVRCPGCGVHVPQESLAGGRCERCIQASAP
ncbi:MAG TPA: hypothetical protein VH394_04835 [Thermoanaerobaculia bacterium]|jgi:hypothetical protein|nr:hypothetical protein [Thermoanaerobaculia bacterium]